MTRDGSPGLFFPGRKARRTAIPKPTASDVQRGGVRYSHFGLYGTDLQIRPTAELCKPTSVVITLRRDDMPSRRSVTATLAGARVGRHL